MRAREALRASSRAACFASISVLRLFIVSSQAIAIIVSEMTVIRKNPGWSPGFSLHVGLTIYFRFLRAMKPATATPRIVIDVGSGTASVTILS